MSAGIDAEVLLARLQELGEIGRDEGGRLVRLAVSDADRAGRDLLAQWLRAAGLEVAVDAIGNLFGIWQSGAGQPLMVGSHIDTVIDAGIYDGCYGVLAGLAVVEALRAEGLVPARPLVVAAFTNEEGVRFAPDMMGSLVHAGGLDLTEALASVGTDGTVLGEELRRIGYAGSMAPGTIRPAASGAACRAGASPGAGRCRDRRGGGAAGHFLVAPTDRGPGQPCRHHAHGAAPGCRPCRGQERHGAAGAGQR
nr:M20/M25/M40 family metallo-hydrolase [Geminicoccus flavidas]